MALFRILLRTVWIVAICQACLNENAAVFPLPIPQRQTSFPLTRPTQVGRVVGWGQFNNSLIPSNLTDVVAIAPRITSLALRSNGTVVAFDASLTGETKPVPSEATNVVAIAAGAIHSAALRDDGTVVVWGDNSHGQLDVPIGLNHVVAISAGVYNTVALLGDGTTVNWGEFNGDRGVALPQSFANLVQVACHERFVLGLKADGTLVFWGPVNPELAPPIGLTGVVAIATGSAHAVALKSDGTVRAWGRPYEGETNVPPNLNGVVAIAAGQFWSFALKSDGSVIEWGNAPTEIPPVNLPKVFLVAGDGMALTTQGFYPKVSIATSRVNVTTEVNVGLKYQLESSADLIHFFSVGAPFVADRTTITQEYIVSETGQYFRVQEVP